MAKQIDYGDGSFTHQKHSCKPNTPDKLVKQFRKSNNMHFCRTFNCTLTEAACKKRRKKALAVKRYLWACGLRVLSTEANEADRCISCRDYVR